MRTSGPLTDLDLASIRAFELLLAVRGPRNELVAMTSARRYATRLAVWRLQWPAALPPEHRGRIQSPATHVLRRQARRP